ncbi:MULTISPECIES: peptide MFS transporter [unclassified Sphingobium]|uniref:peptide MFS transporter n=1 Tax=unclassified Sphingobium TaxID=2611147 RepID=UPI000D16EBAF|nr:MULTISPECIES: peptide MFS transporter [unclassified Sphingobium]MBG6117323.1 POT family proton-dependent oligopeptide transporter [Sphingobium sp. JAI105]PSO11153.1 MFS transporter [Sphingobium sp. AEW4]TWD12471.1 POT family proton-dependent oligopeptide transporter [Sphingobium sp. AEW010]TWD30242.1 POT family proton-dependent oligopeptide transporter [Sphingobium sp. AEW013]TWD31003.1 POT family proton-dependent oligopeptide transporter [Sphingobium sp. AEW001]
MATSISGAAAAGKTWLGHPRGLFLLFFAEMWERFSYYGMRAILIFYLTKHFLFGEDRAYLLYGAYTSLVYITPVIGGYLADRFLGPRKAVLAGGLFIAFGHFLIAVTEGPGGQDPVYLNGFYLALASIIVGTGFLKANISVLVGELYPRDDARRDPAFSIFYMGINAGGAIGPLVCGLLGETMGWGWGFGAAGVGMLLGLVMFVWLTPWLLGKGEPPAPQQLRAPAVAGVSQEWTIYLGAILGVVAIWFVIRYAELLGYALLAFAALTVIYIVWRTLGTLGKVDRDRMFAALFLIALNPLFWGLFEQTGSSLNIFTDRNVDRTVLGWDIPASMFQSVNSIFIILLAPLFAVLWTFLDKRRLEPSSPAKFGIGLILCGAGFLVLVAGAAMAGQDLTPLSFVILIYLFHTMAELCFSPVGLSAMTRLSVPNMVGLVMGTWFLAMAAGNFIAGLIARATGSGDANGVAQVLDVYSRIGWFSIGVGVIVLLVSPMITRLMHLDTIGAEERP